MPSAITLQLAIQGTELAVTVVNASREEVRIWDWDNSWGWPSLDFELQRDDGLHASIVRTAREWTKNGPDYLSLAPNDSRVLGLHLNDGCWQFAGAEQQRTEHATWQDAALRLRVRLHVLPTPESERLRVFTGTVCSGWTTSRPPHDWLLL